MTDRTHEILRQLHRLSNDRALPRNARIHIQDAANYIKSQDEQLEQFLIDQRTPEQTLSPELDD